MPSEIELIHTRETVQESFEFIDVLEPEMFRLTIGVRVYPGTPLAEYAMKEGFIDPDHDLLQPTFFLEPELKDWLPKTARTWAAARPKCVMES